MATVVSFVSEKGGTGKTTSTYHIGVGLQRFHDLRVLIVDADYQRGGISGRFFPDYIENFGVVDPDDTTLYNKFQQLYSDTPMTTDIDLYESSEGIDIIRADSRLSTVSADKLPASNNIRQNNQRLLDHLRVIHNILTPLKEDYDYILIDSHPEVSDVLRNVIYASDYCVSPVKLDRQSSIGVATILGEIENVNADVSTFANDPDNPYGDTRFAGSIGMMTREYAEVLKESEQLEYNRLRRTGGIFENYVTEGDGLRRAAAQRVPVFDIDGSNAAKQSRQIRDIIQEFRVACP